MARKKFDLRLIPPSPALVYERKLWRSGLIFVAGIDEAGRGALAGPVAVAALVLPAGKMQIKKALHGVRDSKEMTPAQRMLWAEKIKSVAFAWAVGFADSAEIDALGIAPATRLAASRALDTLTCHPQHLLIDYIHLPEIPIPQTALVKGDARVLSIACASVLAKTTRDALMVSFNDKYPQYGFAAHKGYGTKQHRQAIEQYGPCSIHRRSFAPLRLMNLPSDEKH
ncbi:MAG: ribonuclease HII [Chloroflexota bacterium]